MDIDDPVAIAEAARAVAREVHDRGTPARQEAAAATAALTGWDIGVALSQTLERWNQVTSGYRIDLAELARTLRDPAPGSVRAGRADRYPEGRN